MLQVIKEAALEGVGAASPVQLMEAVVTQVPPEIQIMLKGDAKSLMPKEVIIVAERLVESGIKVGDEVIVASLQGGQFFYILDRTIKYE